MVNVHEPIVTSSHTAWFGFLNDHSSDGLVFLFLPKHFHRHRNRFGCFHVGEKIREFDGVGQRGHVQHHPTRDPFFDKDADVDELERIRVKVRDERVGVIAELRVTQPCKVIQRVLKVAGVPARVELLGAEHHFVLAQAHDSGTKLLKKNTIRTKKTYFEAHFFGPKKYITVFARKTKKIIESRTNIKN